MLFLLICLGALGCQSLAGVHDAAQPVTPEAAPLPGLVRDATRLDETTAEARFDALTALLDERGLDYEIQRFPNRRASEAGPAEGRNVIVTIGDGDRDLIIGAHADAAMLGDGSLSHAMVDNAGAVAVLTRVAETLQTLDLRHRVRVLFFDLEELGLLGSRHYAELLDTRRIAGMVNLDITGYGDTVIYGPAAGEGNDRLYAAVRQSCLVGGYQCLEFAQFPTSDDRSFQAFGIPNVSLATLPRIEARQLLRMLNGDNGDSGVDEGTVPPIFQTIHTRHDTADKLDPAGMTLAYNVVMGVVLELDRAP